ncbi:uncharacterized protein LOC116294302 [Actinia tenebrosa]|nr:uncharacterized protein LOC116294302 [Actinia tenebrosa]XP_031557728.1 uncharacterized protein LOC116294302 [Actinia tenebrosa]
MSSSSSPSVSIDSAHAQDRDESCDKDTKDKNRNASPGYEDKADNLMLLSSIASRMGIDAQDGSKNSFLNSSPSGQISNGAMSAATNTSREEDCATSGQERGCPRSGFLKKVFVLPANSLYLPSQSELCKLRGSRSSYCKVFFNAEMNETDVYEQIRMAFDDLVGFSFRLAVVDQTGKLVFYDGFWTGKVIRRKLRGNSVLYVVPVVEKTIQIDCKSAV